MADEEMSYTTAVGPVNVLTDPSTWAPAWAFEEARPDVEDTLAHATFQGIDPARPANPSVKQIAGMPHALVPSLDDRASSITAVRRSCEVSTAGCTWGSWTMPPRNRRWCRPSTTS